MEDFTEIKECIKFMVGLKDDTINTLDLIKNSNILDENTNNIIDLALLNNTHISKAKEITMIRLFEYLTEEKIELIKIVEKISVMNNDNIINSSSLLNISDTSSIVSKYNSEIINDNLKLKYFSQLVNNTGIIQSMTIPSVQDEISLGKVISHIKHMLTTGTSFTENMNKEMMRIENTTSGIHFMSPDDIKDKLIPIVNSDVVSNINYNLINEDIYLDTDVMDPLSINSILISLVMFNSMVDSNTKVNLRVTSIITSINDFLNNMETLIKSSVLEDKLEDINLKLEYYENLITTLDIYVHKLDLYYKIMLNVKDNTVKAFTTAFEKFES